MKSLSEAVSTACAKMGVALDVSRPTPYGLRKRRQDVIIAKWCEAPSRHAGLYVDGQDRRLWLDAGEANNDEAWIWLLHELEHVVFWHDGLGIGIWEMLYMPWAVGVLRSFGIPSRAYFGSSYTSATTTGLFFRGICGAEVGDWKHPMRSTWYRECRVHNVALGTITERGLPTWRYPDWDALGFDPSTLSE